MTLEQLRAQQDLSCLERVRPQPHGFIDRHDLRRLRRMAKAGLVVELDRDEGRFELTPAGIERLDEPPSPSAAATPRKRPRGKPTSDLVKSARVGQNAEQFAEIAALHVPAGSRIADVTFGLGTFWRNVDLAANRYELHASDIDLADYDPHESEVDPTLANRIAVESYTAPVDCRALPYQAASFDCIVLDPPYAEGYFRRETSQRAGSGSHSSFAAAYSHAGVHRPEPGEPKYHEAVVDLYLRAGLEARRVLRRGGLLIVKCQDEVSSNKQRLTHIEIVTAFESMGFYCRDLFVLVRENAPGVSRLLKQVHARKNHSYFLVFELPLGRAKHPRNARVFEPRE
jgi:hypothetical protein